jgi:hypothetical protein
MKIKLKGWRIDKAEEIQTETQTVLTPWQRNTSRMHSKVAEALGSACLLRRGLIGRCKIRSTYDAIVFTNIFRELLDTAHTTARTV